ncbi:MAG: tyrosine-type recombinase/integrase, partial [Bacillota bacterium]|nr:tyrosine-type recombinase/integrase [Bacillota bacterium]
PDDSEKGLRDKALLEMMYATGIRASEVCELKTTDLDLKIGYVNVIGTTKPRVVPIGKMARTAIETYLDKSRATFLGSKEDTGILFLSYLGEKLTRQGIWKILKFYGTKAGIGDKISPQVLRNSFAAHLIQNGADLKSLQELLGHEDIMATKIYLSVSKNRIMDVYDRAFPRA